MINIALQVHQIAFICRLLRCQQCRKLIKIIETNRISLHRYFVWFLFHSFCVHGCITNRNRLIVTNYQGNISNRLNTTYILIEGRTFFIDFFLTFLGQKKTSWLVWRTVLFCSTSSFWFRTIEWTVLQNIVVQNAQCLHGGWILRLLLFELQISICEWKFLFSKCRLKNKRSAPLYSFCLPFFQTQNNVNARWRVQK